ncbi:CinA family protein [Microbacterium sp. NPDC058342]|uniref:CinA family protein n=1 Tax=Microbacterium sp. NPDC058342 TaxID=3346454 RepID=UPI003649CAE2
MEDLVQRDAADLDRLSDIARSRGLRIAVVESLTSGNLAGTVGAAGEAAEWFAGGVVAYMTDVKEQLLGLEHGTDPCSADCAEQLARGARALFDADLCVSTTGVGGPGPDDGHPPGTVYLGWATRKQVGHRHLRLDGGPEEVLAATVTAAVRMLTTHAAEI